MCIQKQRKPFFEILDEDDGFQEILSFQEIVATEAAEEENDFWLDLFAQSRWFGQINNFAEMRQEQRNLRLHALSIMQDEIGGTFSMPNLQHGTIMASENTETINPSNIGYGDDLSRLSTLMPFTGMDENISSSESDDWTDSDMPDLMPDDERTFIPERERSPFWWFEEPDSPESLHLVSSSPVQVSVDFVHCEYQRIFQDL